MLVIEKWSEVLSWEVMAEEVEYHHGTVLGLRTRVMPLRFACSFIEAPDFAEHLLYAYLETLAERADEGNASEPPFECLSRHLARMAVDGDLIFGGRSTSEEYTSDLIGADLALETMRADLAARGGDADPESYWQHTRELFVAFAQHFCSTGPDYTSELQARSDPHPSVRLRVNGVVSEMPEFARAFSCATGQPMAPAERCLAW